MTTRDNADLFINENDNNENNGDLDIAKQSQGFGGKKKTKSGGGSFESFNLSPELFKAVKRKGYNLPTPIQRKAIPVILEGFNIIAMARTGSGKTGAFVIPIIEKLK